MKHASRQDSTRLKNRRLESARVKAAKLVSPPPPFNPGARVTWNHHYGEVIEVKGDCAAVAEGKRRWLVHVKDLSHV